MSQPKNAVETNLTLRVDGRVLLWARIRASFAGTSVNALIRDFLWEYAALPEALLRGENWATGAKAVDVFRQVMDPVGAGERARIAGGSRYPPPQAEDG